MNYDNNNSYWNDNGKYQKVLDQVRDMDNYFVELPKSLAKELDVSTRIYIRFFLNGVIPNGYATAGFDWTADSLEQRLDCILEKIKNHLKEVAQ